MSGRRHRSAVACQKCRQRKVRCSLTVTGVPCIGCTQDRTQCIIPHAKMPTPKYRPHASPSSPLSTPLSPEAGMAQTNRPQPTPPTSVDGPFITPDAPQPPASSPAPSPHSDEEQTGTEIANTVLGRSVQQGQAPFYTGESPGFTAALDLCSPTQLPVPRHILMPSKTSGSLSEQDREWLQYKGVFRLPQPNTCYELLRAYFHHVHPIMPVLDVRETLQSFPGGGPSQGNLLLIWSMFSVATNFLKEGTWRLEGYHSRKEMKTDFCSRATCLYYNGGETDNTVLLQSALLLGFYHSQTDMHTKPWYWTGVAISLCQIMGLHRCSVVALSKSSIPPPQVRLWRRLWWTCFFRDRWLSLTLGRPLRINLNDCDTAWPAAADLLADLAGVPEAIAAMYIPDDLATLAQYWVQMIHMSKLLGEVLTVCYQPCGPSPSVEQVAALEADMMRLDLPENGSPTETTQSRLATFYRYHLQLHYQAFLITFYRRFISIAPTGLPAAQQESWLSQVRRKMDSAALQSNAILDNMVREKLLDMAGPMTPPLLVPAMHVHLLNCKSPDPLSRRLGLNKLDLCMMVLEQMQHTYPCASIFRGVFLAGIRQIVPGYMGQTAIPGPTASETMPVPECGSDSSLAGINVSDDVIDALLDEASIINLWESINGM